VAEQGVAIEGHLGIQHADMAVLHDDQRVDLQKAHILLGEGLVERLEERHRLGFAPALPA
jgi:hypothetical protein